MSISASLPVPNPTVSPKPTQHLRQNMTQGVCINHFFFPICAENPASWLSQKYIVCCLDNMKELRNKLVFFFLIFEKQFFFCLLCVFNMSQNLGAGGENRGALWEPFWNKREATEMRKEALASVCAPRET